MLYSVVRQTTRCLSGNPILQIFAQRRLDCRRRPPTCSDGSALQYSTRRFAARHHHIAMCVFTVESCDRPLNVWKFGINVDAGRATPGDLRLGGKGRELVVRKARSKVNEHDNFGGFRCWNVAVTVSVALKDLAASAKTDRSNDSKVHQSPRQMRNQLRRQSSAFSSRLLFNSKRAREAKF